MNEYISVGDIVDVHLDTCEPFFGCKVLEVPCAENACWHLRTSNNELLYLPRFAYMIKKKRK